MEQPQQPTSVEVVFEAQKQQAVLEQERKSAQFDRIKNSLSLGTALVFSGTALYGIFTHTMDTTIVCALIGAATTLFTGLTTGKKESKHE